MSEIRDLPEELAKIRNELEALRQAIFATNDKIPDPTEAFKALDARIKNLEGAANK